MPQTPISLNSILPSKAYAPTLLGKQSDLLVSEFHGNKYHQGYVNALFFGANQSGVTTSVGLATTYVGLCLSNPAGNTVNLALRRVGGIFIVAPTALTGLLLITGYAAGGITAHTTPITGLGASLLNGTAPTAKLDSACTLVGTPIYSLAFTTAGTATTLPSFNMDLEGGFVIPPGGYAAIGTTVASGASGFLGSFEWEEIPV